MIFGVAKGCFVPADFNAYNKFLDKVHHTMSGRGKTPYCAEQLRQGVSREIWYTKGPQRLKVFLKASEAEVAYEGIDNDLEIVEHLDTVKGWMQEKLCQIENQSMQMVRYLKADAAEYRNAKRLICAENILITGFCIPGHELAFFDPNGMERSSSLSARSLEVSLLDKKAKLEGNVILHQQQNQAFHSAFTLQAEKLSTQIDAMQTIFLEEDVQIDYDQKWHASADFGFYQSVEDEPKIILWSDRNLCEAKSDPDRTRIYSKMIEAYPKGRTIQFFEPKGVISISGEKDQKEELEFTSNTLIWQEEGKECLLNGNVIVSLPSRQIILTSDKQLQLKKGEQGVQELKSLGRSELKCGSEGKDFTLTCTGEVVVDHEHHRLHMQKGENCEQLLFRDNLGKIYSDHAELEYQTLNQKMVPIKAIFTGNVLVLNREAPFLQKALADRLTLFIPTSELLLAADAQKRVLFYDQANNLEMSAKGVKVKRDKETKKESIQGIGDVRFSFDEQEFANLKNHFTQIGWHNELGE